MQPPFAADPELLALGEVALRNAFYREYSQLVAKFVRASWGLDVDAVMQGLVSSSNPFSVQRVPDAVLEIAVISGDHRKVIPTLRDAFGIAGDRITIGEETAFIWKPSNGWNLVLTEANRRS